MTSAITDHLQRLWQENGSLTPELIVNTARPTDHPLHSSFEWDDGIAGEKYRLIQAGELVRCCMTESPDGTHDNVRAFVSVNRVDGPTYIPIREAAQNDITYKLVLQQAERDWKALRRRYSHLAEFMEMVRRDTAA